MLKLGTSQKMNTKLIASLFGMLFIFSLIPTVSALEFDNVKSYDTVTREVTITNAFGMGAEIGKARLNTPLNVVVGAGYQKVAEFDLWAYEDYNDALKQFTFKDMNNGKAKINRDYDLKYKTYENVLVDDYKTVLSYSPNGTAMYHNIKDGSHYENKEVWKKITPADLKKNDKLTVGVFTDVQIGDYVDWIPLIYGVEVPEWASWTESLNTDLVHYYKMDEGSGTNWSDNIQGLDATGLDTQWTSSGLLGNAFQGDGASGTGGAVSTGTDALVTTFTLSAWLYPTSTQYFAIGLQGSSYVGYEILAHSGGWSCGADNDQATTAQSFAQNNWNYLVCVFDPVNNQMRAYRNGISVNNASYTTDPTGSANTRIGVRSDGGWRDGTGYWDELGMWERVLTVDEIVQLYNSGTGITWTDVFIIPPTITLNSPATSNYTTDQNLEINFTAYDDLNLTNIQLYVNDVLNQSNASGFNNTDYIFDLSLSDGNYTIYGTATDNESEQTNSSAINIFIDSTKPIINLIAPVTNFTTTTLPKNITLNTTVTDLSLDSCWYYTSDNATNVTYTCNSSVNVSFTTGGSKIIYIFANDTLGNENTITAPFFLNYIQETATYDNPVIEGESTTLILNITASEITTFNGTLTYNNTVYQPTATDDGTTGLLTYEIQTPEVSANVDLFFNWTYTLNGVEYNSSNYNHSVYFLTPLNISATCDDKALRFDLNDEINLTALTGDIKYNFQYGITNNSYKTVFGEIDAVTTFYLCVNASVSENYTIGYGEIQYTDENYVDRRYYLFEDRIVSNNTLTNINLRSLESAEQTSFILTMEDTSLNVYDNKYTALWRWYPDLNEYQIVEMGKTDEKGQTVAHVDTEDVDYRVGLYYLNGTLLKLGDPVRFICSSAPCSFSLTVGSSTIDYSSFFDVQADISYNETSEVFTLVYNDPNELTSSMRFVVTRETGTSSLEICNDTSSGFTGVMSCNTSAYNGIKTATAYRSASPPIVVAQKIISKLNTTFKSSFGLFISVFLWLAIVLSGFSNNPIFTIILGIIGLIPALLLGSINITIFTGIAVAGAIIIHFIKRSVAR